MAIFDGVGSLIKAPNDQGVYEIETKGLIPLPVSIAPPITQNENIILPPDMELMENSDNEIIDEGFNFPESNGYIPIIVENVDAPKGIEIAESIDTVSLPEDIKQNSSKISLPKDVIKLPDPVILPSYSEPDTKAPVGDIVKSPIEGSLALPGDSLNKNASIVLSGIVSTPKDANSYTTSDLDDYKLIGGVVITPNGVNWSNTIVDRLFTGINDVLDYIRVPVPESIKSLYSKIQEVEGYLSDPRSFAIQLKEKAIGLLLGSNKEDRFDPIIGKVQRPKSKQNTIFITGITSKEDLDRQAEIENRYEGVVRVDEGYVKKQKTLEVSDDILESQFAFQGRKSTVGVTLRLNHLWDLKFEPYNSDSIKCILPKMYVRVSTAYKNYNTGKSSEDYVEQDANGNALRTDPENDWEDSMPVLSYDLDYLSLASRDVELYGGSTISVPEIIKQNSLLTTQILDDENKRWRRWFQRALDAMCSSGDGDSTAEPNSIVMPYKKCCMVATLYQYRTDSHILSHKKFIVLLKNYQVTSSGAGGGAGTPDVLDVEWSIVGEIKLDKAPPEKQYTSRSNKRKDHPLEGENNKIEQAETTITYINIV